MSKLSEMAETYLGGVNQLTKAVSGMNEQQLKAKPIPGKWSTLEVVCHLVDFDPIYADRMKRIIAEENPSLVGADENRFAAALCYQDRNVEEELAILANTRKQMARILKKLPDSILNKTGVHNERGPVTLENLLSTITNHIPHHVGFILEKRKALGIG